MDYIGMLERDIRENAKGMAYENDRSMDEYEDRYPEHFDAERRITSLISFIRAEVDETGTPLGALSLNALEVLDQLNNPVKRYVR